MADATDRNRNDEEDEEEEEANETIFKAAKDAVLFAIDVSPSMLARPPLADSKKIDRDSATSAALKCAYRLMQQRIISHPNDMMGVLLFGTEDSHFQTDDKSPASLQYPHCYLLTDLDKPEASDVKRLRSLVENQDGEDAKKLLVPSNKPVTMSNVLFCANQIFSTKAPNFSSRRLFLVTDNDNPHADNKEVKSSAIVRAKDLYDLGVVIELFPISQPDHDFDRSKFYDDVTYQQNSSDPEAPAPMNSAVKAATNTDGISLLDSLLANIHSRSVPKNALFANLPLEIGPDLRISVKGYVVFKRQEPRRSCYVYVNGEKSVLAEGVSAQISEDTAKPVEKTELRKAFKFGGQHVTFTPDELTKLRSFGDPVIRIIGFKPQSMLPLWANTRASTFIYPSEEEYIGSTRTFAALHHSLLEKRRMGLAWYIARRNAVPVIAALIPGAEQISAVNGTQTLPAGFWLIPLPFADDIRTNPDMNLVSAPDALKDKMRLIVQQLQLPGAVYDPARYPNPSLQWHYRILQAMALEEDLPEQAEDKTIPRHRQIHKRTASYVTDWFEELQKQYQIWQRDNAGQHVGAKRATPGGISASGEAKKSRVVPVNADSISDEQMQVHAKKVTISKLTVHVLKSWLNDKGLSTGGKKTELVERVENYYENKMQLG